MHLSGMVGIPHLFGAAFVALALLSRCQSAVRQGTDFPTVWESILKAHPLVRDVPVQVAPGRLEIRLINGQVIVYETETGTFSLD